MFFSRVFWNGFGRSDRLAFALSTYLPGTGRSGQEDLAEHFVEKLYEDDLEDFVFEVVRILFYISVVSHKGSSWLEAKMTSCCSGRPA